MLDVSNDYRVLKFKERISALYIGNNFSENASRRKLFTQQNKSNDKMQGHPMIKQMSEEKERGLEIKQRVVRQKRKSLDSAPTALSLEQFKKDERNKRRREAYARKKQLLIPGEHSMVKQMSEEKERGLEIEQRVVHRKRKSLDSAPTLLSMKQSKTDERNKRRREAYARKKQLSIPGIVSTAPSVVQPVLMDLHDKGKEIVSRFSIFEIGSTSSTNLVPSNKGKRSQRSGRRMNSGIFVVPLEPMILPSQQPCKHCHALRFYLEPDGFCCMNGQVSLLPINCPPELRHLFVSNSEEANEFRTFVRTYNSSFAFTSFGVIYDKSLCKRTQGIYTFRIQGQVYHFINELESSGDKLSHLQLYFYDTDKEVENRIKFSQSKHIMRASIVEKLIQILQQNPYSVFFRSLSGIEELDTHQIIIRSDPGLDQRVYNTPSVSQVAAIWIEGDTLNEQRERDIIICRKSGQSERIKYQFGCYDPLQYPLLLPFGEPGWHFGIQRVDKRRGDTTCHRQFVLPHDQMLSHEDILNAENEVMCAKKNERTTVSCREYYCYRLQIRAKDTSIILHSGRLLQQYCVDMYVKVETSRLQYFRNNQDLIRADLYQGIMDSVCQGETKGSKVGRRIVLPPSFIGGPRDMRRRYVDAMALVQRFGKPDIFLTMTCNASWPEIKECLGPNEETQNRPDLVVRVFRAKMEELKKDIVKRGVFGKIAAYVYTIEFQKRGLPHMHFLGILERGHKLLSPESFDRFVSAEIPEEDKNPHLHAAVLRHMMHGPCGDLKPDNVCMNNGHCRKHYPKDFEPITRIGKNSYPMYKRRDIKKVKVRGQWLDNRWVVPFCPYLLAKFDCHMNVEICSTIKVVKYLYKYIYKGHDKVAFHVTKENDSNDVDEISQFQNARWISAPEAVWRLFGFPMSGMYPSVVHLQVHLENQQSITFRKTDNLNSILKNDLFSKTMLTEFFSMNASNEKAKLGSFLYREFPEHFVWLQGERRWKERVQNKVIGRIVTIHPSQGELYYLRLLLNNVRKPTSFASLKNVDGKRAKTFREAALLLGLLEDDDNLDKCLQEATIYQMPYALRQLFASILAYCAPSNPQLLWEKFKGSMSEDFARDSNLSAKMVEMKVLQGINSMLQSMGKNLRDFRLCPTDFLSVNHSNLCKEIEEELNLPVSDVDYQAITMLTSEQHYAFTMITEKVFSGKPGYFFIDGPGGTGKTFLYKAILAAVRSKKYIALATASSGVAASILPGGRTAHSRFKIPIDADEYKPCNVGKQSGLAKLLRMASLIIWDEAPMAKRQNIEALNEMLKDINESDLLFGGKVVVFGGDFRQIPPVINKGTKEESICASLIKSDIWKSLEKIKLTENMRARHDPSFCDFLLRIGNGTEPCDEENRVELPTSMIIPPKIQSNQDISVEPLIDAIFPDLEKYSCDPMSMLDSVILSPRNECVNEINDLLIERFPGMKENNTMRVYTSLDRTIDEAYQADYEDFLNSICPTGLPPHKLILKKNCPIILLRNIDPSQGLCNGTRLICRDFQDHVILAEIAIGNRKGEKIFLHRIALQPSDKEKYPVAFTRKQFPVKLCFAMTINKAQGQTLQNVGIYLREPVFSHGQLYVALSRAMTASAVKVLIEPPDESESNSNKTRNVVYKELLALAESS